jgi:hypothetical protein
MIEKKRCALYMQRDEPDNFDTASINVELGVVVVVLAANLSNSRPTDAIQDSDFTGEVVRLNEDGGMGSKFEKMGAASALKTLDIGLPMLK